MLHAVPTSETTTNTALSKTPIAPLPERELPPHLFGTARRYSSGGTSGITSGASPDAQHRQSLAGIQHTRGNQAVLRMLHNPPQIARMAPLRPSQGIMLQRKCVCGGSEAEGECEECKTKREGMLQRRAASPTAAPAITHGVPPIVHNVLRSPGQPLNAGTRAFMEPRFGHDFSQVRVHTDARAAESAQAVNALAYTVGRNVVFGAGQYAPERPTGQWVLAHELTHVIQQNSQDISSARDISFDTTDIYEQQANMTAKTIVGQNYASLPTSYERIEPALMLLTPDQFRIQLGSTPQQKAAIDILFTNPTFLALWNYLRTCTATPGQDLGPLELKVTPGLHDGPIIRFGGYTPSTRTLEINPTKAEHVSNPSELVDTIVHELIHAVFDLQPFCTAAGSSPAPLGGAASLPQKTRVSIVDPAEEATLMIERGPGASDPCGEFIDINAAAQQMIVQIIKENIQISHVGHPTLTFVNEILRRNPAAMSEYEACRGIACAIPDIARRNKEIARCSANIIGKFIPPELQSALLPGNIYFDLNSASLRADSLETLNLVVIFLKTHPDVVVDIFGNTDPTGTPDYNKSLAQLRAESVAQELLKGGVAPGQIGQVISHSGINPRAVGPATHWKDRRVDIVPASGMPVP